MVVKALDVRRMGILQRKLFGAIIGGGRCLARAIVVEVLLNDDLLGVVTSRHVEQVENIYTILLQIYS